MADMVPEMHRQCRNGVVYHVEWRSSQVNLLAHTFQSPMSEREKNVLNAYLDGYDAKLTINNYAKLCNISTDTAARDIHDLEDKVCFAWLKAE